MLLILLVAMLPAPLAAAAQRSEKPENPEFVGIRVGFDNRYKVGQWTPVELTLRGGARPVNGLVTVTVEDDDGTPSRVGAEAAPSEIFEVPPGAETTVRLYVKFGHSDGTLTAALHEPAQAGAKTMAGGVIAERTFRTSPKADATHFLSGMAATQELIVTVGPASVGTEQAISVAGQAQADLPSSERQTVAVRLDDAGGLPARWYGYEGVDALVLATSTPEIYGKLSPEGAQIQALDEWVRMGGKLVLLVGSQAGEILAEGAPLARFAPGRLEEVFTVRRTSALEGYAGGTMPVPGLGPGSSTGLPVARLADVQGRVEVEDARTALVVRTARGLGQVVFVAADLDRPPLSDWSDRGRLLNKLLDREPRKAAEAGKGESLMHYGYNDMAGKLRSQLDEFHGVKMVSFWAVAGLIFLYILLIGPGDYYFLRKVVGRMQWTWVTFPAIVLLVSIGAYALACWLKGDRLRVSQVDLVDVDTAGNQARGTTWLGFFSPRTDTYDLSFRPMLPDGQAAGDAEVIASWMGLPGEGFGGMQSRATGPGLWRRAYDFSAGLRGLRGVPVQVWSTKSLTARWHAPCKVYPEAHLVEEDGLPEGTIRNTLAFPLRDCILAYGHWGYDLGTLEPGGRAAIEPMSRQRVELGTLLNALACAEEPEEDADEEADDESRPRPRRTALARDSIPNTLRTMMFFEALGSSRHEALSNRYQQFVDASGLLKAGRAILVGTAPGGLARSQPHGAVLLRDDQPMAGSGDRHLVMYRFVFPVKRKR